MNEYEVPLPPQLLQRYAQPISSMGPAHQSAAPVASAAAAAAAVAAAAAAPNSTPGVQLGAASGSSMAPGPTPTPSLSPNPFETVTSYTSARLNYNEHAEREEEAFSRGVEAYHRWTEQWSALFRHMAAAQEEMIRSQDRVFETRAQELGEGRPPVSFINPCDTLLLNKIDSHPRRFNASGDANEFFSLELSPASPGPERRTSSRRKASDISYAESETSESEVEVLPPSKIPRYIIGGSRGQRTITQIIETEEVDGVQVVDGEEHYRVERIYDSRFQKDGGFEYYVSFAGKPASANSWVIGEDLGAEAPVVIDFHTTYPDRPCPPKRRRILAALAKRGTRSDQPIVIDEEDGGRGAQAGTRARSEERGRRNPAGIDSAPAGPSYKPASAAKAKSKPAAPANAPPQEKKRAKPPAPKPPVRREASAPVSVKSADRSTSQPPPPEIIDGEEHYEVERILKSRFRNKELQYFVTWVGFDDDENEWVPAEDLSDDCQAVLDFHSAHPDSPCTEKRRKAVERILARRAAREKQRAEHAAEAKRKKQREIEREAEREAERRKQARERQTQEKREQEKREQEKRKKEKLEELAKSKQRAESKGKGKQRESPPERPSSRQRGSKRQRSPSPSTSSASSVRAVEEEPEVEVLSDGEHFLVEKILNSRWMEDDDGKRMLEYYVHFKGQPKSEDCWVIAEDMDDAAPQVVAFHTKWPAKPCTKARRIAVRKLSK